MKKKEIKSSKNMLIAIVVLVLALIMMIIVDRGTRDYATISLRTNRKTIFTMSDLKLNDLKFGSTQSQVIKALGKPKKESEYEKHNFKYKKYEYEKLTITLREYYSDYMLVGIETTSNKYKTGRNIKVGSNISTVMKSYSVKNSMSNYLYGNYTASSLNKSSNTKNIYFGLRSRKQVVYVNRDEVIDKNYVNVSRIIYSYKRGKVNKIIWSYDYE